MIRRRAAHRLVRALLVLAASAPVVLGTGDAMAGSPDVSGVTLHVAVGYGNIYRGTNWTPVRVTLHNSTGANLSGILRVPQNNQSSSVGATPTFHGLYQVPVTLAAGSSKHVVMDVPGSGIQGRVRVTFVAGGRVMAAGSAYPVGVDTSTLLIGVLAGGPGDYAWLGPAIQGRVTTHVIPLSAATLDPVAESLQSFDIIALTDMDSSQLDAAQLRALEQYVRGGGSLLLIGGPTWQKTLRPLPRSLLPGIPAGQRVLPDLKGLGSLGTGIGAGPAVAAVLARPTGTVWASERSVPLVVRRNQGEGTIEYLAFDPAAAPLPPRSPVLQHLVAMAAPLAIARTWAPGGFRARFDAIFRNVALTQELANVPPATLPLLAIFAVLTLLYVLLLGPANFLLLRRLGHQRLALITIPALSLVYLASMGGVAAQARSRTASLNTVGLVTLDGRSAERQASQYVSLSASLPGTYRLIYDTPALPAPLPQISLANFSPRSAAVLHNTPLGMSFQETPRTTVSFLSMKRWTARDLTLDTSVSVPGSVRSALAVNAAGDLVGSIYNKTDLRIQDPVVVAGQSFAHLHDLPAGAAARVHLRPGDAYVGGDASSLWTTIYGSPSTILSDDFGPFGFGDCCNGVSLPRETTLRAREGNAIAMLARARALTSPSGVLLAGWTTQPLGSLSVDGAAPQRRDLSLVVVPLAVRLPSHGSFRFEPGTLSGQLVDMVPRAPQICCSGFGGFGSDDSSSQVSVGTGGSLTFEFDLARGRRVRFQRLSVSPGERSDNSGPTDVYDWTSGRWVTVDLTTGSAQLPRPGRFVSSDGRILVRMRATTLTGDLTVLDQHYPVEISAQGAVK